MDYVCFFLCLLSVCPFKCFIVCLLDRVCVLNKSLIVGQIAGHNEDKITAIPKIQRVTEKNKESLGCLCWDAW